MKNNEIWTTTTTIHKPKANALYQGVIALFVHYNIYVSMRCVSQPSCLLAFYCTSPLEPIHTLQKLFSLRRQPKVKRNKTNFFLYATKYDVMKSIWIKFIFFDVWVVPFCGNQNTQVHNENGFLMSNDKVKILYTTKDIDTVSNLWIFPQRWRSRDVTFVKYGFDYILFQRSFEHFFPSSARQSR